MYGVCHLRQPPQAWVELLEVVIEVLVRLIQLEVPVDERLAGIAYANCSHDEGIRTTLCGVSEITSEV